jgi:hypothetical protein
MDAALILCVLATVGATNSSQGADANAASRPVHHTAYFAGQPGWESNTSTPPAATAPPRYDRYATPQGVQPPPGVIDRGRTAVVETGNTLREGVEAGFEAADREFQNGTQQAMDSARNAGQDLANQFKGWAGTQSDTAPPAATNYQNSSQSLQPLVGTSPQPPAAAAPRSTSTRGQISNPFAPATPAATATNTKSRTGVAPPPSWAGAGATGTDFDMEFNDVPPLPRVADLGTRAPRAEGGWTSISSSTVPPSMPVPQLSNTPRSNSQAVSSPFNTTPVATAPPASSTRSEAVTAGPGFPATITANPSNDHSLLSGTTSGSRTSSQAPPPVSEEDFQIGWGDTPAKSPQQATIGSRYNNAAVQAPPTSASPGAATITKSPSNTPTAGQPQASQPVGTPGFDPFDNKDFFGDAGQRASPPASHAASTQAAASPANGAAQPPSAPPATGQSATTVTTAAPAASTATGTEQPWMPLLVVSLSLAGSIGANLFLGWSYMDARQKYRHLVQKTANQFRRAVSAA